MNGIIVYEEKDALHNQSFIDYLIEKGREKGLTLELCLFEKFSFGIHETGYFIEYDGKPFQRPGVVLYRCREYLLSRQFEAMGIPVVNSSKVCEICNDKALTYQYVAGLGIPMVPSLFVRNDRIQDVVQHSKEDMVVKAVNGHGGSQVCLVNPTDKEQMEECLATINGEDAVVQPLIKGRGQDLRVYIVGGEIVAAVLRSANGDFRANFSLGGSVMLYTLSEQEEAIVKKITKLLSLDYAGIDFIIGENGELIFNEIEDVVGARMLYQCSDLDIVPLYLDHIIQKL
ncbi:MAG: RimK family alpha-L-glutamate ligase [bacterium]|nr:RimK family alpha-L-glutamate ligase [bacterium]